MPTPTSRPRRMPLTLSALCFAAISSPLTAQSWSASAPAPAVSLGVDGDLLAFVPTGIVGFDELQALTVLPFGSAWTTTPAAVPPRISATMANSRSFAYLFGGVDLLAGTLRNDLWRYDPFLGDWALMTAGGATAPGPSPRSGCKAAPTDDGWLLVFYGGEDANGPLGDSWVMLQTVTYPAPPVWVQIATPPGMVARADHAMSRAPGQSVIVFGGRNGALLGDTWLFQGTSWSQHVGLGPPPAADCRMTYDRHRDVTVLLHPNGETWEWNGFAWRLVGATGAPAWTAPAVVWNDVEVLAVQQAPSGAGTVTWHYTPSPAHFDTQLDATCNVPGHQPLQLQPWQRDLPILGETFHMRITGVPPTSWLLGAYELTPPTPPAVPLGCGCTSIVLGASTGVDLVPFTIGPRDWLLPIANHPALHGTPISVQGFVVDPANPCWLMATQGGLLIPGL